MSGAGATLVAAVLTNAGIVCVARDAGSWSLAWAVTPEFVAEGTS